MKSNQFPISWRWPLLLIMIVSFSLTGLMAGNPATEPDIQSISELRDRQAIQSQQQALKQMGKRMERLGQHKQEPLRAQNSVRIPENPFKNGNVNPRPVINISSDAYPRTTIDVQVNYADNDTITQGDEIIVTVEFSDSSYQADVAMWLDMDDDGLLDPGIDMDLEGYHHIMDNDMEDEAQAIGVYQTTFYGDDDAPNRISNIGVLYEAIDMGGSDVGFVYIEPLISPYSVSGSITPVFENIIVVAAPRDSVSNDDDFNPWMTVTDDLGDYELNVPTTGTYDIMAFDFLGVTDGMYPDTMYRDVLINGALTGYDFNFILPTSGIEGYVEDEFANPLDSVEVWVDAHDGPGYMVATDVDGYYFIGVNEGDYRVGIDNESVIPDYLVAHDVELYVAEDDTAWVPFTLYGTDATISGTVYLNNVPFGGALVGADCQLGWTKSYSGPDGYYEVAVTSAADNDGGYHVNVRIWDSLPPGTVQINWHDNVQSGSTGIDIYLETYPSLFEGHVYDATTMEPIWAGIEAFDGMEYYYSGTGDDGYFHMPLPNGEYGIMIGAEGYYTAWDSISLMDDVVYRDYYLNPLSLDGSIFGYVVDQTGAPLIDAEVTIGNNFYWDQTFTDESGYYEFAVPYGVYGGHAWKDGYSEAWTDTGLVVNDMTPDVQHDYQLYEFVVDAVIAGVVIDGETRTPVGGSNVNLWNDFYNTGFQTGPNGEFFFDIPSGTYMLDAWAQGYHPAPAMEVTANSGDSLWVEIELWPHMVQPPDLFMVSDVPHDQGRQVRLGWNVGSPPENMSWTHFSVWRMNEAQMWDFIEVIPFHGMGEYFYVAPTLVDSNHVTGPIDAYWSTFMVSGHTHDPWQFYDSNWLDGYSIDNLMPRIPMGVQASTNDDVGGIDLSWQRVPDEDFEYFAIYRGTTEGFNPGEPLAYTIDTSFVDGSVTVGQTYYYLVSATDHNGNESDYSDEVSLYFLSTEGEQLIPEEYALYQNYPNPFNPTTTIDFALPEAGLVVLKVYNLMGEEVATLVNDYKTPGTYSIQWNAANVSSGVYLLQIKAAQFSQTRKLMLMK